MVRDGTAHKVIYWNSSGYADILNWIPDKKTLNVWTVCEQCSPRSDCTPVQVVPRRHWAQCTLLNSSNYANNQPHVNRNKNEVNSIVPISNCTQVQADPWRHWAQGKSMKLIRICKYFKLDKSIKPQSMRSVQSQIRLHTGPGRYMTTRGTW